MKENKMVNYSLVAKEQMDHSKGSFMRKGEALSHKTGFVPFIKNVLRGGDMSNTSFIF